MQPTLGSTYVCSISISVSTMVSLAVVVVLLPVVRQHRCLRLRLRLFACLRLVRRWTTRRLRRGRQSVLRDCTRAS